MALTNLLFRRGDDDTNDHIDSDTPRSGVATPQPDPSDKRLPGIMHSYFGQVGSCSSSSPDSGPVTSVGSEHANSFPLPKEEMVEDYILLSVASDAEKENIPCSPKKEEGEEQSGPSLLSSSQEPTQLPTVPELSRTSGLHSYPTPPASQSPSLHNLKLSDASSESDSVGPSKLVSLLPSHRKSISIPGSLPAKVRRESLVSRDPLSSVVTASTVHATHFSKPSDDATTTTIPNTPTYSHLNSYFHESSSHDSLKKLTDDASRKKSIPPTPRALSSTTSKSDGSDPATEKNGKANGAEHKPTLPTIASSTSVGAPAPALKGKLTVKIVEARGLRRSKDPYVVAVFQRNELVSAGPRSEPGEESEKPHIPMGGIPIMRSGSDSGRPMAIPMKSRQSSNTSLSDYRDFKVKPRLSMTNPKWDTEAIL